MPTLPPPVTLPPEWAAAIDSVLQSLGRALGESGLRERVLEDSLEQSRPGDRPALAWQRALDLLGERWQGWQTQMDQVSRKAQQTDAALADLEADLGRWREQLAGLRQRLDRVLQQP
jgi:hypothetical protein